MFRMKWQTKLVILNKILDTDHMLLFHFFLKQLQLFFHLVSVRYISDLENK